MAHLQVKITTESPLSLGGFKSYAGLLIESLPYIPGGILRGALGALKTHLKETEAVTDQLDELDLLLGTPHRNGIILPNCYPTEKGTTSWPIPITARKCKRTGGFITAELRNELRGKKRQLQINDKHHGIADTLLMQLAYDAAVCPGTEWRIPLPFNYLCPICGGRTEPVSVIYEAIGEGSNQYYISHKPLTHRQTRVAINRARLTAEEEQLYTVAAVDEAEMFIGECVVDSERAQLLQKWLPRIDRIGGRISRGFGQVRSEIKPVVTRLTLQERIAVFNETFREFYDSFSTIALNPTPMAHSLLFSINLQADAMLHTLEGLPTLDLCPELLREYILLLLTDEERRSKVIEKIKLEQVARYVQPKYTSGWQTAWQLPKEVLLASRMGGLYVFAADTGGDESKTSLLLSLLERLEATGIGEWREDGFGRITVCDPFHLEVNPV